VHYAEYLVFCAQGRNLWLADMGISCPGDHVVARVEVDYVEPARLADGWVSVEVLVEQVGRSSLTLRELVRGPDDHELVRARSVLVRFDPEERRVQAWTEDERRLLGSA
jgi:acyl-CoA thioesterase FadM